MTVAELIERLKEMPQDMEVAVKYRDDGGCYSGEDEDILLYVDKKNGKLML